MQWLSQKFSTLGRRRINNDSLWSVWDKEEGKSVEVVIEKRMDKNCRKKKQFESENTHQKTQQKNDLLLTIGEDASNGNWAIYVLNNESTTFLRHYRQFVL